MNNIFKFAGTINVVKNILNPAKQIALKFNVGQQYRQITRNLWYMCNNSNDKHIIQNHSTTCICGCQKSGVHTKAEKELWKFLADKKTQKSKTIPTELDVYEVKLKGAELSLTKEVDNETISMSFNVNHTVDTDVEAEIDGTMVKPELGKLKSKLAFKIEKERESTTLNSMCSLNLNISNPVEEGGDYNDIFVIDEVSIYEGDWNENVYAVSGEVLDSDLYDLILNYLEEKGISNEFVEKFSEYSTSFEHSAYIGELESLSKFVSGK